MLLGNPAPFAFKYTIGNVLSICSYCFLVGPVNQINGMFAPDRRLITLCYLTSCVGTLICVFWLKNWLWTLIVLTVQSCSMILCTRAKQHRNRNPATRWRVDRASNRQLTDRARARVAHRQTRSRTCHRALGWGWCGGSCRAEEKLCLACFNASRGGSHRRQAG